MTREIVFAAAPEAIPNNFPSGNLPGMKQFYHAYFNDSTNGKTTGEPAGIIWSQRTEIRVS